MLTQIIIRMRIIPLFLYLLIFLLSLSLQAQEENKIEVINGKKYYLHKVEKGHTLYAISKKYLIEIEQIIQENPEIKNGLKIDQTLKIPVVKENKKLDKKNNPEIQGNYILHKVEKGQTLYSLAKQYNIDVADIVAPNPGVDTRMQIGQIIKIPVNRIRNASPEIVVAAKDDGLIRHKITKDETLFSIAKQYSVKEDSITLVNNGLPYGLKEGETIIIPKKVFVAPKIIKKTTGATAQQLIKDKLKNSFKNDTSFLSKEYINIALMLPFYLDENDSLDANRNEYEKSEIYPSSQIAVEFYEGFLLAVDSLKNQGLRVGLFVYDSKHDSDYFKKILQKPELKEMDIIVGPLYSSCFSPAVRFAEKNKIHIVSPFSQQNTMVTDHPFVSKVTASQTTQMEKMVSFIADSFPKGNIVLVHNSSLMDKPLVTTFKKNIKQSLPENLPKETQYIITEFDGVKQLLSKTKTSIIVVPSNDQAFITDLITKLNFVEKEYKIVLFGIDSWLNFENLDINYLHKLQTHITACNEIDFDNKEVKKFIKKFRNNYFVDPSNYAFKGFDVGYYYLSALKNFGKNFENELPNFEHKGLQTTFTMTRLVIGSGFENQSVSVLKYHNYKLMKVE